MTMEKFQTYRGDIRAAIGIGNILHFVTVHPEGIPTEVCHMDGGSCAMPTDPLPCGGVAITASEKDLYVAGTDQRIYFLADGKAPKTFGQPLPHALVALVVVSKDRLAVLSGPQISILARKDGKVLQTLELPETGTCLVTEKTGTWLAAGTDKGTIAVFEAEGQDDFEKSESDKVHEGAVTAILFEPEELRFYSAGADQKLYSTHARGKLEPEDKGRGNNHEDIVTSLILAPGERFLSGSRDNSIKTWPRTSNMKPATMKDAVGRVVGMAMLTVAKKAVVAAFCDDNSIRFYQLNDEGRFEEPQMRVYGALDRARRFFNEYDPKRRENCLNELAKSNDIPSLELLAKRIQEDADHALQIKATELLAESNHPRAIKLLEEPLNHRDGKVRVLAFKGLQKHLGSADLRFLDLALRNNKADIGRLAIKALEPLAAKDDQALTRLIAALDNILFEIRQAALAALESAYDADSPESNLVALNSTHADIRRWALIRLYQRNLLTDPKVRSAIRWRTEDPVADVRQMAFLLMLLTREKLAPTLRAVDPELNRQFKELEKAGKEAKEGAEPEKEEEKTAGPAPKLKRADVNLAEDEYDPLLQATASRALDTCLRGARGLALLGDPRAFGLLLQLSREEDVYARVEVCRALAALDDPRSIARLRSLLFDANAAVRDSAFTALATIHAEEPLDAAAAGLLAANEDVRRRGLNVLVESLKKKKPKDASEVSWGLAIRALNDSFGDVRREAYKAVLNQKIGGGGVDTLKFALQSVHADIRREVLNEVMGSEKQDWATPMLYDFFNDPDSQLRKDAFEFAVKKNKELTPLEAALASKYEDTRKLAIEGLIRKHTKAAQAILLKATSDSDEEIRRLAIQSLIDDDAKPALTEALNNPNDDVKVRAATALAHHGLEIALAPLVTLATLPRPHEKDKEKRDYWAALVASALDGLAELGSPAAMEAIFPSVANRRPNIRSSAVNALIWSSRTDTAGNLRSSLTHEDPKVRYRSALGLAYLGDAVAASLVFAPEGSQSLDARENLTAALTLGPAGDDRLSTFLDDADDHIRRTALLTMLLLELKEPTSTPTRLLACLSSRMPRVRLTAALALEKYADPVALRDFVVEQFNDRGDENPWKVKIEVVESLAEVLVFGDLQTKARFLLSLKTLAEKEQASWNHEWSVLKERFSAEISALKKAATAKPASAVTPEELRELAFGAYVGLVREQGGVKTPSQGPGVTRVRQTALKRILDLSQASPAFLHAAQPVMIQALADPHKEVRIQAFEQLQTLGMDRTALGSEALECGHTDLGIKGLELLTDGTSSKEGRAVLEKVMMTRMDDLATEAAKLLVKQTAIVPVATRGLAAASDNLRQQSVTWLAAAYDSDSAAQKALRGAIDSRYQKVRESAALELAGRKDATAFDVLAKFLPIATESGRQYRIIQALAELGNPKAAEVFLERIENDPAATALTSELLTRIGSFRRPDLVDRMFALEERRKALQTEIRRAIYVIAGADQELADPEDETPQDRKWLEKQFPRHPEVLVKLAEKLFSSGDTDFLNETMVELRWSLSNVVDPILATLVSHPDEEIRSAATEAVGFRLRKRGGPAEPLLKLLSGRKADVQFIAAEALAQAGRADGISILLSAIDFLDDVDQRERAVLALGELADKRALDVLLRLVNEENHALQEAAAEAIGHLGQSSRGDDIYRLLERLAKGDQDGIAVRALKGLRWLNTRDGWNLIREKAQSGEYWASEIVELLGYNDDPATRDLLLKLLRGQEEDDSVLEAALVSARRLWGNDSLEPDYARIQSSNIYNDEQEWLARVCEKGDVLRILEIYPQCPPETQDTLATALLTRPELPVKEAGLAVAGSSEVSVRLAARILGRAKASGKDIAPALEAALKKWVELWKSRCTRVLQGKTEEAWENTTTCLRSLLWACSRYGVGTETATGLLSFAADHAETRPVRLAVLEMLSEIKPLQEPVLKTLEVVLSGNDAEVRTQAASILSAQDGKRAVALAEKVLSDRISFNRLISSKDADALPTLKNAVNQPHYQGVVLPHLIARGEEGTLATVARDIKLPEATRLGAVEALGELAKETSEAILVEIGKNDKDDEDVRKAAWKALSRSKRARIKAAK